MVTGWDESSSPYAQEYRKSSHPNPRKAEILAQPNKKLSAAYKSIFCDTLSSHSVLSWKWQVDVCIALTVKVSLLGCMNSFLTEFLILPSLLCAKQNKKKIHQKNPTKETKKHTQKKFIFTEVYKVVACLPQNSCQCLFTRVCKNTWIGWFECSVVH